MTSSVFAAAFLLASASVSFADQNSEITVMKPGTQASTPASPDNFTGSARVDSRFQRAGPARVGGGTVTFEPGARTAWHSHPLGQTLIVTAGVGFVQRWGDQPQQIGPGDVVWIPPGVKHWHGATSSTGMSHIAIGEALDGKTVDWMEKVSDEQYPG